MNKLSQKSYELMPNLSFKFSLLYNELSLDFISYNINDPIKKLIIDFSDIAKLKLNSNEITKILYFNIEKVNKILYDSDKVIKLEDGIYEIDYYFYLSLLINYNKNIINFDYSFDIIKKLNEGLNSDNLRKIIKARIIIDLINDYRANYYYEYNDDLNSIEGENQKIIVEYIKKYFELISFYQINNNKIDEIYITIIISLIINKKFDNYNYIYNIVEQLYLKSINLPKTMIDELIKVLDEKKDYAKYYIISKKEDIFEITKINFYFILLKYILKNSFYIYQIPFLLQTKRLIIEIIKYDLDYLLKNKLEKNVNERLEYILEIIADSKFYFLKYIIFKKIKAILDSIKNNDSYQIQNEDEKIIKDYFSDKNNQLFEDFISKIKNLKTVGSGDYIKSFIDLVKPNNSSQIDDKEEYNNNSNSNINDSLPTKINVEINNNVGSQNTWNQGLNQKSDPNKSLLQFQIPNKKEISIKVIKFVKIINKNTNKNALKTIDCIKELSNGYFVTYGIYDYINIYDSYYILKFQKNISRNSIYDICENSKKSEDKSLELYIFCGDKFYLYKLEIDINDIKIKRNQEFINDYSIFCFEVKNKNGKTSNIICGTKGVKYEEDLISQVLISNNDILYINPICGGIIIEDKYFALISNEIISDKNVLILYNLENLETIKKPYKIEKEYTFNLSQNNLSYVKMESSKNKNEDEIILLCACKKYFKSKENGILIVNININKLKIKYTKFLKTGSFEVYCFCPISLLEKRNNSFFSLEKSETKNAKYILIGGFEQCKGNIKLFKLFYNNNTINLECIDDDIIDFGKNNNFRGFKKPINCIIQNKKNGEIISSSWDGNLYLFDRPNINYFSKYEKIYENNFLFKKFE